MTDAVVCGDDVERGMLSAIFYSMTVTEAEELWAGEASVYAQGQILWSTVLPFLRQHQCQYQVDNARPHRARIVQDFFRQQNVGRIDWPAR